MGVLEKAIQAIWGKEIQRQLEIPFPASFAPPQSLQSNYDTCAHCRQRYGLMDFHDCLGEFDALRIWMNDSTNSVRMRFRKLHSIMSNEDSKLVDKATEIISDLSVPEYGELMEKYNRKLKGIQEPDLDLEEDLWNS